MTTPVFESVRGWVDAVHQWPPLLAALLITILATLAALVTASLFSALVKAMTRKQGISYLFKKARTPLRVLNASVFTALGLRWFFAKNPPVWAEEANHLFVILIIISAAWLIGSLLWAAEGATFERYKTDVPDNLRARRVRTQVMVVRRATSVFLVIAALGGVLLTFEGARSVGSGLLASAGVLSVVVGLAAQNSLANVFAGIQIAFTEALRVDDVVVVEEEWGRIEEITMTYVVVHLWDDRRLILPSTYFTTSPFENWTRHQADLLGTVEFDLDWSIDVHEMRKALKSTLENTDLWDGRVGILQVTEATNALVRVRALVSALDAPKLFDLRCIVREELVNWVFINSPHSIPRTRVEETLSFKSPKTPIRRSTRDYRPPKTIEDDASLFTGSVQAERRGDLFSGRHEDEELDK